MAISPAISAMSSGAVTSTIPPQAITPTSCLLSASLADEPPNASA